MNTPFWKTKSLQEMNESEWESLCDGCAKCCLNKLEDIDTGELHQTNVACDLLDTNLCRCTDYANRNKRVFDCLIITPELAQTADWLPHTCAYRLLARQQSLPDWHPLISKNPESTFESGNCVTGKVISERDAEGLEQHLVDWEY